MWNQRTPSLKSPEGLIKTLTLSVCTDQHHLPMWNSADTKHALPLFCNFLMWCFPLSHIFENTANHSRKLTYLWSKVTHGNLKPWFQWSSCCFKRSMAICIFGYRLKIPELSRQRQEGEWFKTHLSYTRVLGYIRPFLGKKNKTTAHISNLSVSQMCCISPSPREMI